MSIQKPGLPKGTRDFGPLQMQRRNFILEAIRETFYLFGFQQIETPAIENLSTLTGKYGDEGDQLLFKVLNSGDFFKDITPDDLEKGAQASLPKLSEKGLRYDLTVPFARYVVMNKNEVNFPFKRFQIQPVWRADRPQKGRYREFYQCDADVVGTDSLICELEILLMIRRVFKSLGINEYSIRINNRKMLTGLSEVIGASGREGELCVAIDKLDKIGWEKVKEELLTKGFESSSLDLLQPVTALSGDNESRISFFRTFLKSSETGKKGLNELEEVFGLLANAGENLNHVEFDPVLARGLSYYTGAIFEVKVQGVSIGSVSGGGRYDNLTGVFGLPGVSGVGISFGVDRLYDVMEELELFPENSQVGTKVLITFFEEEGRDYGLRLLQQIRSAGIAAEIYPELTKIKKQMAYADKKQIPYVIILGSEELDQKLLTLKTLTSGTQEKLTAADAITKLSTT
jgi:histidyl-tRNA synthetase